MSNADGISSVFYKGVFFVGAASKDKGPQFRLIYNSNGDETNGIKNLYLLARPSLSSSTTEVASINAFDLKGWIQDPEYGRDTTIHVSGYTQGIELRYIKAYLYYFSGMQSSTDGPKPGFTKLTDPFEFYIYR